MQRWLAFEQTVFGSGVDEDGALRNGTLFTIPYLQTNGIFRYLIIRSAENCKISNLDISSTPAEPPSKRNKEISSFFVPSSASSLFLWTYLSTEFSL